MLAIAAAVLKSRYTWLIVVGVALVAAVAFGIRAIYDTGFEAGRLKSDNDLLQARIVAEVQRNKALEKLVDTEKQMREIERDAEKRIALAKKNAPVQIKEVERILYANPQFSAVARPADLQRLRDEQLAAIAAAANRAPDLPGAGVSEVRPANDDGGREPGADGRGGH